MKIFLFFYLFLIIKKKNINCENKCFEYSCKECEDQKYGSCKICRDGFVLIDGTCPCSDTSCALCDNGLAGLHICYLCKNGYYNYKNDCYCDIDNCEQCSENSCLICKTGYFYNITSKECQKQKEEEKLTCFDANCDACYSPEKGGCDYCKDGYVYKKGECHKLPDPDQFNNCKDGYYYKDGFCEEICEGVNCTTKQFYYYVCPPNDCLVCSNNVLQIFSECNNSEICQMDGCLNCITNEECIICNQGYYLFGGKCLKCTHGCSICSNNDTCQYCMSGFKLNSLNKCVLSDKYDFDVHKYKKEKNKLIKLYYPEEDIDEEDNIEIIECDANCLKCYDNTGICKECDTLYILENNKCIKHCSDNNCLECFLSNGDEQCKICTAGYYLKNNKCYLNCSDVNCLSCTIDNNIEICSKCLDNYKLDDNQTKCIAQLNYFSIIFSIIGCLLIVISLISFCVYRKRRSDYRNEVLRMRFANQGNSIDVYHRNDLNASGVSGSSGRPVLSKEKLSDEFDSQRRKMEKGNQMCQYCKKKPGKFKCDCGCIVCKEHSNLKKVEGKKESHTVCFVCGKNVKKVNQIKYECHICLQKKISVAHFKCNCAIEACKDCYIKCKMSSDKCPGCRAII